MLQPEVRNAVIIIVCVKRGGQHLLDIWSRCAPLDNLIQEFGHGLGDLQSGHLGWNWWDCR